MPLRATTRPTDAPRAALIGRPASTFPALRGAALATLCALTLGTATLAPPAHAANPGGGIAWAPAATTAQVEAAFAKARAEKKPLFLYWGAAWCPPCNQVKATVFNRADFIAASRQVVAVNLDGDSPGAQKLGGRYKVRGYPTMILFSPQGEELTRLPGEVDAPQYLRALQGALAGGRPIAQVLADARAGKPLSEGAWQQLAWYSWETDEQALIPAVQRPAVLAQLAKAVPPSQPATAARLTLKAVSAAAGEKPAKPLDADLRFAAGGALLRLLGDPAAAREQMDLVTNEARALVTALSAAGTPERQQLSAAWEQAARRLQADATLSRADRLGALFARVTLATLDLPEGADAKSLPPALVEDVTRTVAAFDREITDGYERQSVITNAAELLKRAGRLADSDALLQANLARSHSPYYLMSQLGGNARARGDKTAALDWYQKAWEGAKGPATRIQWGAGYINALVDLGPDQGERIERAAATMLGELGRTPDAFHERNARSAQRIGAKLAGWAGGAPDRAQRVQRLDKALAPVCGQLPAKDPQRERCEQLFKPA